MSRDIRKNQDMFNMLILCCATVLSLFTVTVQVRAAGGFSYLAGEQLKRHNAVIHGTTGSPYQYRVFSEYLVEGTIVILKTLKIPLSEISAFITFRLLQNIIIFSLAMIYYQALGITTYSSLIGISLLSWGMSHATYNSDLSFNLYSDVIFYLLAGITILYRKFLWIIPITGLAALNRETSGLIPCMLLAECWFMRRKNQKILQPVLIVITAIMLYIGIFYGLRYLMGPRWLITASGKVPGFDLFRYNVSRYITWLQLVSTLGILPLMAIFSIRQWPYILKSFFWIVVPPWFLIHFFASAIAETRLLLVPHALIFLPGALLGLKNCCQKPQGVLHSEIEI